MRHLYFRFLLFAVISLLSITANATEYCYINGIKYLLYGAEAHVTSGVAYTGTIVIPESFKYNGMTRRVTTIGNDAFKGCTGLTSITIPNSVTTIGSSAFSGCTGLTSVSLNCPEVDSWFSGLTSLKEVKFSEGVTTIGYEAFKGCTGLTSITIPNSVTSIGQEAFEGTAWYNNQPDGLVYAGKVAYKYKGIMPDDTKITLKEGTLGITGYAFRGRTGLTAIIIPNSVTNIGQYAFSGCIGLTSIIIPNIVTSIGREAFEGTAWYNNQPDGLVYAGKVAYKYKGTMPDDTKITLKEGTLGIAGNCFNGCGGLISINIPNSVKTIGWSAFFNCSSLTSVTIPNSVTTIEARTFCYCRSLTSVTIPNSVNSIEDDVFHFCTGLTSITIPNSVISIRRCAFQGCTGLASITIPNSVASIGGEAFYDCTGLKSVTIGNSVTTIGDDAFRRCTGIEYATLLCPHIGNYFNGFPSLKKVIIGSGVKSIESGVFGESTGLMKVIAPDVASWCAIDFKNEFSNPLYYAHHLYSDENTEITNLVIPNGVTSINNNAFYNCESFASISIPSSVTTIGENAFICSSKLNSITVNSGNTVYDSRNSCNAIIRKSDDMLLLGCQKTVIPSSVKGIADKAFYNSTGLKSITIPKGLTSIGRGVFWGCSGLETIKVESGNPVYDSREGCNAIILKDKSISDYYSHYSYLNPPIDNILIVGCKNTVVPKDVNTIGQYAFAGCTGLTSFTVPRHVRYIMNGAFDGCDNMKTLTIPNVWEGYYDFSGCTNLRMIYSHVRFPDEEVYVGFSEGVCDQALLYVPMGTRSKYNGRWGGFSNIMETNYNDYCIVNGIYYDLIDETNEAVVSPWQEETISEYTQNVNIPAKIGYNEIEYSVISVEPCAFYDCQSLMSIKLPEGLTDIGYGAFAGCIGLTNITIPKTVNEIGIMPFAGCYNLESITVASGNKYYDSRGNCNAIIRKSDNMLIQGCETTVIPNNVTGIGQYAFYGCQWLKSIHIPNSIKTIGYFAFNGCGNLKDVYSHITAPFEIDSNVFGTYNATLYVPKGTSSLYENTNDWNRFSNIVEMDYGETGIAPTVIDENDTPAEYYSIDGTRLDRPQRGINIIRMSDGTTRKVVVK